MSVCLAHQTEHSPLTGPKPEATALLHVTGKNFGGGIVFGCLWGEWRVWDCPPYLRAVIGQATPTDQVIPKLEKRGFKTEWITKE